MAEQLILDLINDELMKFMKCGFLATCEFVSPNFHVVVVNHDVGAMNCTW